MRVLLTGATGFLGWHTRVRLRALTDHEIIVADRGSWTKLTELMRGVDAVIHCAGVNRGTDYEVEHGNITLARDVVAALRHSGARPRIIFANSIQIGNGTPYGTGKETAGRLLADAAREHGLDFVDIHLPNLFGEHGVPNYNSFVATFVNAVVSDQQPIISDKEVALLHAQVAAQSLIDALSTDQSILRPEGTRTTVQAVYDLLRKFNKLYDAGDIPPLMSDLDLDLFNTLRATRFPSRYPIMLAPRSDSRGTLVEVVRAHGGQGQTFISTTKPGITRGDHFHLRKVERFVVVGGTARISIRKVFSEEVVSFDVTGDAPVIVDMPTMWVHNITNIGTTELTTLFWTNELFDPSAPDTYPEAVQL